MQLDIYPDVVKFVGNLEPKRYKQILTKILMLFKDATPQDSQELKGYSFLRVDVGEYRIIYSHSEEVITIVLVGKRNDEEVYRDLRRSYKQE